MYGENRLENEGPTWKMYMRTLKVQKMKIDIEERLPGIIDEWYQEQGRPVPPWQMKKPYFNEDGDIIRP